MHFCCVYCTTDMQFNRQKLGGNSKPMFKGKQCVVGCVVGFSKAQKLEKHFLYQK